jgi:hypothetical protein
MKNQTFSIINNTAYGFCFIFRNYYFDSWPTCTERFVHASRTAFSILCFFSLLVLNVLFMLPGLLSQYYVFLAYLYSMFCSCFQDCSCHPRKDDVALKWNGSLPRKDLLLEKFGTSPSPPVHHQLSSPASN